MDIALYFLTRSDEWTPGGKIRASIGDFCASAPVVVAHPAELGYFEGFVPIMRLAIVAASSYEENGQVDPIPNAELDVELFGRRLAEPDAGFTVHAFDAQRGLPEGIEELSRSLGRASSLVFYFWGYALLSEERGPALLLDGPKLAPFTLARLRRLLSEVTEEALVVVDATLAEGSAGAPLDVVPPDVVPLDVPPLDVPPPDVPPLLDALVPALPLELPLFDEELHA